MKWKPGWGLVLCAVLVACGQSQADPSTAPSQSGAVVTTGSQPSTGPTPDTAAPNPTTTVPSTTTVATESTGLLVLHKTTGFEHASIPAGVEALARIADRVSMTMTASADADMFEDETLESYAAIIFLNTTGDVLDSDQEKAMERFISRGGGFVGIHSAADTEYDWEWYGRLVGARFSRHPAPQSAELTVVAPDHPTMQGIPRSFVRFDEWYDFQSPPDEEVEVLITLDEETYDGGSMGNPHSITWAHEFGGGRSFYTAFGHTPESFSDDVMVTMLTNAITWVTGSAD